MEGFLLAGLGRLSKVWSRSFATVWSAANLLEGGDLGGVLDGSFWGFLRKLKSAVLGVLGLGRLF